MEKHILQLLVQRFEKSSKFKSRVIEGRMSVNLSGDKKYHDDDDCDYRIGFNVVAKELEKNKLIKLEWRQWGTILDKIHFQVNDVEQFCQLLGWERKQDILEQNIQYIKAYLNKARFRWVEDYFLYLIKYIEYKHELPPVLKEEGSINLFKALIALDTEHPEILERVFSKKYLGNSKTFEDGVRGKVISVIKNYYRELDTEGLNDEEILSEFGIDKSTTDLHIKGHLIININGNSINLDAFPRGVGLDAKTLTETEIVSAGFDRILSIENLANYKSECESTDERTLVVFSSGFYSPRKRKFLCKLRNYIMEQGQDVEFLHWGDLDFGGLNIFRHINSAVFPELKPYKMDTATFLNNLLYAESFKKNEKVNLTKQLNDPRFTVFHDLIHEMLHQEKTLEQEALLID